MIRIVFIQFDIGRQEYCYRSDDPEIKEGDIVTVPAGGISDRIVLVSRVKIMDESETPYPANKIKRVNGKLDPSGKINVESSIEDIVKFFVDDLDVEGLLASGAPADEYDTESKLIAESIKPGTDSVSLADTMVSVMGASFSKDYERNVFYKTAAKIDSVLHMIDKMPRIDTSKKINKEEYNKAEMDEKKIAKQEQRKNKLIKSFDMMKDLYLDQMKKREDPDDSILDTLSNEIIVPMMKLDFEKGIGMWEYMLSTYYGVCDAYDYYYTVERDVFKELETSVICQAFSVSDTVKKYLVYLDREHATDFAEDAIEYSLKNGDVALADELTWLIYYAEKSHFNTEKNLWTVLDQLTCCKIDRSKCRKIIPFVNKWKEEITDSFKKLQIELAVDERLDECDLYEDDLEALPEITTDYLSKWNFESEEEKNEAVVVTDEEDEDAEENEEKSEENIGFEAEIMLDENGDIAEYDDDDDDDEDDDEEDDDDRKERRHSYGETDFFERDDLDDYDDDDEDDRLADDYEEGVDVGLTKDDDEIMDIFAIDEDLGIDMFGDYPM